MFAIIGIFVVFGCIAGGYFLEKGNFMVLLQPAELLIIGGAAVGSVLISNPPSILKKLVSSGLQVFKGSRYTATVYLDTLKFLSEFFDAATRRGLVSLEDDVMDPAKSALFQKHPTMTKNPEALNFFCDTMRSVLVGGISSHDIDSIMEADLEVLQKRSKMPAAALSTMADSLPGLGIVAAVLGVVITMGALGGPPEEIGHKVAAALVGTFLGILLCYGLVGPISQNIKKQVDDQTEYFLCIRMSLLAYVKDIPPALALEAARRSIPHNVRPTYAEMDKACRAARGAGVAA
ncbi:flagellar motor stator protein MotA [uncultured Paludibaculum sp.]|uniref:flagellar motor stator protein MotA n=1 Tax=uncultured Paludibaculum sp. TaxID=1765020 RepID=UPI002AABF0A3|nr:flagellar motor stator protein MotA [uncultured Paludibaculum sp.]